MTRRHEITVQGKDGQQKEAVRETVKYELAFPVAFVEVSRKIHAGDSLQMHRECKVSQNPFLALGADQSPCLFVCSFSPTLSVVFYVAVKKCVISLSETTG